MILSRFLYIYFRDNSKDKMRNKKRRPSEGSAPDRLAWSSPGRQIFNINSEDSLINIKDGVHSQASGLIWMYHELIDGLIETLLIGWLKVEARRSCSCRVVAPLLSRIQTKCLSTRRGFLCTIEIKVWMTCGICKRDGNYSANNRKITKSLQTKHKFNKS